MEYEQKREEIAEIIQIGRVFRRDCTCEVWRYGRSATCPICTAKKILSLDGIEIRAVNQSYPTLISNWQDHYADFAQLLPNDLSAKECHQYEGLLYKAFIAGLETQDKGMRKAGFVKVIPKKETEEKA